MIVAFGECLVDLFAHPRGAPVETATHFVPCFGGAPANVALVAARLGARSRFVGAVGRDAHGERLVRTLAEDGVDVSTVLRVPERTGITFVRIGPDGGRSFLFYRAAGADMALSVERLDALPAHPLDGASWLVVGTSALVADPIARAARRLIDDARGRGVAVALDLNVRAHLWSDRGAMLDAARWLAARCALIKASEDDLVAMDLPGTLEALAALAPGALPVLTLAARGAVARVGGRAVEAPAPALRAEDVVDTTGAGDAFVGALLALMERRGMLPGRAAFDDASAWESVLRAACAVGTRAVTAMGAVEAVKAPWPEAVTRDACVGCAQTRE